MMERVTAFFKAVWGALSGHTNSTACLVSDEADQLLAVVKRVTDGMQR